MTKQSRSVRNIAAAIALACAAPAYAHNDGPIIGTEIFAGVVQERDVSLVFSYLREALAAAMQGREARPPNELQRRGDVIAEELKRRGAIAGDVLLQEMERRIREEIRALPSDPRPRM